MRTAPELRAQIRARSPLIHCITNPISINQCANAVLAMGARPMMAEHPDEVQEITETASALLLNLGSITAPRMEAMRLSARTAKERGIPLVLDAVGAACSTMRRRFALALMDEAPPAIVKGNYSEITALCQSAYRSPGVDADGALRVSQLDRAAAALARSRRTVVLASGRVDIVTDGARLIHITNGTPQLSAVTGTGCMLGALAASYAAVSPGTDAAAAACVTLGICGQLAETPRGSGSFLVRLLDSLSSVTDEALKTMTELEVHSLET